MRLVPSGLGFRVCSLETVTVTWSAGGQTLLPVQGGYRRRHPLSCITGGPHPNRDKGAFLELQSCEKGLLEFGSFICIYYLVMI